VKVLLQGAGIRDIAIVELDNGATTDDVIKAASSLGMPIDGSAHVWIEGRDEPIAAGALSGIGLAERSRLHVHTCLKVSVTVNFASAHPSKDFPPVADIDKVKAWAVGEKGIDMSAADAADHVLQVCATDNRPDTDVQIGSLTTPESCAICFDLVAKERIEGWS
jgi:hypothetical protein